MSVWQAIGTIPAALYDERVAIESLSGRTYAAVSGMEALECTFEPLSGSNAAFMMAMHGGATHVVHLRTYQPTIAREWRVVRGGKCYKVNDVEHHDGTITDLLVQATAATTS